MAFWSGEKLGERLPGLITDRGGKPAFDPGQIDGAAYRLHVGNEVYVTPAGKSGDGETRTIQQLDDGEGFVIPSGQFGFLITREVVEIPADAMGLISMRASIKWRGLVNVSGFHVDPGFKGQLTFAVFNAGPTPVHIREGDDWFLIWFVDLDRVTGHTKKPTPQLGIRTGLVNAISGEVHSLAALSDRVDKIETEHSYFRGVAIVVTAVAVGMFLKYCAPATSPVPTTPATPLSSSTPLVHRSLTPHH